MRLTALLTLTLALSACNFSRMAVKQVGPMLSEASPELQKGKSWEFFRLATPGSLQLAETLLVHDPNNPHLLALLTKGYASYAFVVNDTEHLAERLQRQRIQPARDEALISLSKGLEYGFRMLEQRGVTIRDLQASVRDNKIGSLLDSKLNGKDVLHRETVFFTGTAWLLLANYRQDIIPLVRQISLANELIAWVCKHDPDFQNGMCPTMQGVFHLARPAMLGGKPDLAKEMLTEAMKKYPENLMIPITLIEWHHIPFKDADAYRSIRKDLSARLKEWRNEVFIPGAPPSERQQMLNLFNAMAERRLTIIEANEKNLF